MVALRLILVAAVLAQTTPAPGTSTPPPSTLEALRTSAGSGQIRVWSRIGTFVFPRAHFDSTGIWSSDVGVHDVPRQALIQTEEATQALAVPRPIPWDGVDSIAVERRHPVHNAARGAMLGLVVGVFALAIVATRYAVPDVESGVTIALVTIGLPTAVGAMVGARAGGGSTWEVVYRAY